MVTDTRYLLGTSEYAATKQQVSSARHWVRETIKGLIDDDTAYDLSLCAVELADNARKHGRPLGVISVALYLTDDLVRLEVANDRSGAAAVPHVTDNVLTEEGHGLRIVSAVAAAWGRYANGAVRQVVWCQFPRKTQEGD
jgi:two-component sensor histidine kinase